MDDVHGVLLRQIDELRLLRVESWEEHAREHIAGVLDRVAGEVARLRDEVGRLGGELQESLHEEGRLEHELRQLRAAAPTIECECGRRIHIPAAEQLEELGRLRGIEERARIWLLPNNGSTQARAVARDILGEPELVAPQLPDEEVERRLFMAPGQLANENPRGVELIHLPTGMHVSSARHRTVVENASEAYRVLRQRVANPPAAWGGDGT